MSPKYRAQLAAAIARFQADIQRLLRGVRPQERERLLAALDPTRAGSPRSRAAAASRKPPASRARPAAAGTPARPAATRRTRKPGARAGTRVEPAGADAAVATSASTAQGATEASAAPMMADQAGAEPGAADTSAAAATEPQAPAATGSDPAAGWRRGKRVRWTRETIIDELARCMVGGTAIDASFLKRHGPPGLVPAAVRIFGRFDAALNVAGLHVAKLYPDGPARPNRPGEHPVPPRPRA